MYFISGGFAAVVLISTVFVAVGLTVVPAGIAAPMALLGAFLLINAILWLEGTR